MANIKEIVIALHTEHKQPKRCKTCKGVLIGAEQRGERCNKCLEKAAKKGK